MFDRLNTGGEKLNPQELRNCLYSGPFNRLIVELSGIKKFTNAWGIPARADHILSDGTYDEILRTNKLFSTMADCQIVLRYFAFRDDRFVVGSTRSILDNCMARLRKADEETIKSFRDDFKRDLDTAISIFGPKAFRVSGSGAGRGRLSRPLFDAEMIAIGRMHGEKEKLVAEKQAIVDAIRELTREGTSSYATIIGRPNTAAAIKARISVVEEALRNAIK